MTLIRAPGIRFLTLVALVVSLLGATPVHPFEIIDDDGVSHRFATPFSRIISLYPAHTENLIEMGAADSLIGVSAGNTGSDGPIDRELFSHHDSAEKFIAARPDCILIRPMISNSAPHLINKLRKFGITVISLMPTSSTGLYNYWDTLGLISGHPDEAQRMVRSFRTRLGELERLVGGVVPERRPRVYFEAIHARMKTFAPDSIAMFCLESAGGRNIAGSATPRRNTNIAGYSKERILADAESIDIYLAQYGRMNRVTVEEIVDEPGFGAIKAVREKKVYLIEEDLVSRPTPRLLDGMWRLHRLLYPEPPHKGNSP